MTKSIDQSATVAVVTGAASGIGRAIALRLATGGARVIAADLNLPGAEETASRDPERITALAVDVAERASAVALSQQVHALEGASSILVNAAGWDRMAPFLDGDADFAQKVVGINYLGPVNLCSAFLPQMIESGHGRIVNLASDAGRVGSSGETVYAGAKGGVIALTKSLAREMAKHGITVNCVCPGPTDTPLFRSAPANLREALIRAIPMRRIARPDEIAAAVTFFVSPETPYITGQVLSVSGGLTMAG